MRATRLASTHRRFGHDRQIRRVPLPTSRAVSPANRSLERGIEILRAFRPGSDLLGNGELAERTGLSRATVSRLTQTLVGMGMLQQEPSRKGYRLAPAVLSLAHAMRSGSTRAAGRRAADARAGGEQANQRRPGRAGPRRDGLSRVDPLQPPRGVSKRRVGSARADGADIARPGLPRNDYPARRRALYGIFKARRERQWSLLLAEIERSIRSVRESGFCSASWQPGVVALATPLKTADICYSLNVSVSTGEKVDAVVDSLSYPAD